MRTFWGKKLTDGMWVVVTASPPRADLKVSAVPIRVVTVQYPTAVFEVARPMPQMGALFAMTMGGGGGEGTEVPYKMVRHTFAANVKWVRFREVSSDYVDAYNRPPVSCGSPDWLTGEDK